MIRSLSPVARICLGLIVLLLTILTTANVVVDPLGTRDEDIFRQRKALLENLAVQYSILAANNQIDTLRAAVNSLVARNTDLIVSAALRLQDGKVLAITRDHPQRWVKPPGNRSTLAFAQVPIFQGDRQWGTLEVSFRTPATTHLILDSLSQSMPRYILLVLALALVFYYLYMRKTLRDLDPSAVIPERVKTAFDVIPAGIALLEHHGRIVLVNRVFSERIAQRNDAMLGSTLAKLPFSTHDGSAELPWAITLSTGTALNDVRVQLDPPGQPPMHLLVSTSPIAEADGRVKGVLVAFDDVTELDQANDSLRQALSSLEQSHAEIEKKNEELVRLATRDPLTGCLNRRAFFDQYERLFMRASGGKQPLSVIMTDIDHFKRFNDNYGHAVGDKVIQYVARILTESLRPNDLLCRYGGEEFCVVLGDTPIDQAVEIAERIRARIESDEAGAVRLTERLRITSSFGVSEISEGIVNPTDIIEEADAALYKSKENGRNRVSRYAADDSHEPSRKADKVA